MADLGECNPLFSLEWVPVAVVNTLLVGSLYTLSAVGVSIVISVVKVPNFAQGDLVTLGAYVASFVSFWVGFPWSLVGGIILATVVAAFIAVMSDEMVYKPLQRKGTSSVGIMAASIAISMLIKYSLYLVGGVLGFAILSSRTSLIASLPAYVSPIFTLSNLFLWTVPLTIVLVIALELFFVRSRMGKALRAVGSNPSLARVSGVNVNQSRRVAWAISGGLAGMSGAFWAAFILLTPELGLAVMLRAFAASTIGGLVSFSGTIVGGYIVGAAENLLSEFLNLNLGLSLLFQPALVFAIMVAVLIFAPEGLASVFTALGQKLNKLRRRDNKNGSG